MSRLLSHERYELLFSRASAHSLDLVQLAGEASKLIPASSPRRRRFMEKLFRGENIHAPIGETVTGSQTRVSRSAYYTHAELGQSLAGLGGAPYLAAMYSFALDGSQRVPLYHALRERTAEIARREEWPERIPGVNGAAHHYEDELTALVLDVDWLKPLFVLAPQLYAIAVDVSEELWRIRLLHYYVRILQVHESWLARAQGHITRRLVEEFSYLPEPDKPHGRCDMSTGVATQAVAV